MAKVGFKHVGKVFPGGVIAVDDFNLEVADREFLVLVGPSGCGKSTTLRMVAGLEEISSGEIHIEGQLVNDVAPKNRDIAMVFQNYALYPHMTVYDNMAFGLKLRKYPKAEIDRRVRDAAEILSISNLLERKPRALSGGQKQRVAVGRAIVRKPKVFLFDEPLSNLDAKLRVQMRAEIGKLHNRLLATMIYVTHDQLEAMTLGDRIVVMQDGVIQQVDTPLKVYDRPANKFVAGFIGTPPMNFIEGGLRRKDGRLFFHTDTFAVRVDQTMEKAVERYDDQPITLGIRPEDLRDIDNAPRAEPELSVTSSVEVIEPVGAESMWYLSSGKDNFIAKVDAHCRAEVNHPKTLVFQMHKAHFFDPKTEVALV